MGVGSQVVGNVIRHVHDFTGAVTAAGQGGTGIELHSTDHVVVAGNTISDCWWIGVYLHEFTNRCVVANNTLVDVAQGRRRTAGPAALNGALGGIEVDTEAVMVELHSHFGGGIPALINARPGSNIVRANTVFNTSPDGERQVREGGACFGVLNIGAVRGPTGTGPDQGNLVLDNVSANTTGEPAVGESRAYHAEPAVLPPVSAALFRNEDYDN